MKKLNLLKKFGLVTYLFIYLIFPNLAITENTKIDLIKNLEKSFNSNNLKSIKNIFNDDESLIISKKFSKIIKEFPNAKWKFKRLDKQNFNENIFKVKVVGEKKIDGEIYILESNFIYMFSSSEKRIKNGVIKNLLTTVRSDSNKIDIVFKIPDKVLSGTKYDLDIILNEPLGEIIVAGGIKAHQEDSYIEDEILIEPLVSGGIFKTTRAPSKPGIQIWSGVIVHPDGMISFTKSVNIVDKI